MEQYIINQIRDEKAEVHTVFNLRNGHVPETCT
jgi:hypothetical protein